MLSAPQIHAESFLNQFKDKDDGWFDASDWVLNNAVGFMPVPIIITEPAVGEGLGLAALFFHPRISAIGFVGIGKAANSYSDFDRVPSRITKGIGIRYMVARKLGMHAGIDVAQGPEDTYWYLQMGSAW